MINTAQQAPQTASMAQKNGFNITKLIVQFMCVTEVQWSRSCLHVLIYHVRPPGDAVFCFFVPFFLFVWSLFFNTIFHFGLFSFIITADPADHALGSIYILSSSEFYFGKGISRAHDLHTDQAYGQKKP